jgi:hypothetical protein
MNRAIGAKKSTIQIRDSNGLEFSHEIFVLVEKPEGFHSSDSLFL